MPVEPARPFKLHLVTGATGLLGSHIAEQLVGRGDRVRALVRPGSDTAFLARLGVGLLRGDLTHRDDCRRAVQGIDTVYHSAAKVGDWGAWEEFQRSCLDATESLAEAALEANVRRFVHISSTSAYGHPLDASRPIDEGFPLGDRIWWPWDYYTRSKVECERLLWRLAEARGLPLTVIRPSWLYGERDRTTVARLVGRIDGGGIPILGRGDNALSAIYAGDVACAALLAADDPGSIGEAYNVTDQGPISQREFFALFAEACGSPRRSRTTRLWHPYSAAFAAGFALEAWGRLTGRARPPVLTRYAAWLMGRSIAYSTAKARERLGWRPSCDYRSSIGRTVRWYRESERMGGRGASGRGIDRSERSLDAFAAYNAENDSSAQDVASPQAPEPVMTDYATLTSPGIQEMRVEDLRRVVEIFVAIAYPDGEVPESVRRRMAWLEVDEEWIDVAGPPFEPSGAPGADAAVYSLRLGNLHYPHMKLQIQPWPTAAGFLVSVNTHDQVFAPEPGSGEAEAFRRLQAENQRIKLAIETEWDAAGLPTFLRYLRDYIEGAGRTD